MLWFTFEQFLGPLVFSGDIRTLFSGVFHSGLKFVVVFDTVLLSCWSFGAEFCWARNSERFSGRVGGSVTQNWQKLNRRLAHHIGGTGIILSGILKDGLNLVEHKEQLPQRISASRMADIESVFWKKILMGDKTHVTSDRWYRNLLQINQWKSIPMDVSSLSLPVNGWTFQKTNTILAKVVKWLVHLYGFDFIYRIK